MTTPDRNERLRHAVAEAASELARQTNAPQNRDPKPAPGDLYVFGLPVPVALEWLVVRHHPDDANLILLAPADDFFLAGPADVVVAADQTGRPFTVRCGEALWVPAARCPARLRVGTVPNEVTARVRQTLAALTRGTLAEDGETRNAETDPEYAAWMDEVAQARAALEQRAEVPEIGGDVFLLERFVTTPPGAFYVSHTLAASSGGPLLDALSAEVAADGPRFHDVPLEGGGCLLLAADAIELRVAWKGPAGTEPPPLSAAGAVGRIAAEWEPGVEPDCRHAVPGFSWVDGQITLTVGVGSPRTFTVRL